MVFSYLQCLSNRCAAVAAVAAAAAAVAGNGQADTHKQPAV